MLCHIHCSGSGGLGKKRYNVHIKYPEFSVVDSTVPETVVPHTLSQAPVFLARRIWGLSVPLRLLTKPLSLVFYAASRSLFMSCISSLRVRMWSALDNATPPVTAQTSSALSHWNLKYLSCVDVNVFRSPRPHFLTSIVLRAPTRGRGFSCFRRKDKSNRFLESFYPLPRTRLPFRR